MKGIITTIQRMSIHDGPGIRSTVFLKGCNLRCKWCHNPETFKSYPELEWQKDLCLNCGACTKVCPTGALKMEEGQLRFSRSECNLCFECTDECYSNALRKIGKVYTPEKLVTELEKDMIFFSESNGGVTFSGGEPMLQADFVKETAKLLKDRNVHIAMETNMTISWEKMEEILPFMDLIMADIKMMDEDEHIKWTGSGNKRILENIRQLDKTGIPYELRTPVVPGVNHSSQAIEDIALFVSGLTNIRKYELLPYHPLADFKYENLGMKNPFEEVKDLDKESLELYAPILKKYKINKLHGNNE